MSKKVILTPLENNFDYHSLKPSSIKPEIEISQEEFNERFADSAHSSNIEGEITTTYYDGETLKSRFMGGSYKVK